MRAFFVILIILIVQSSALSQTITLSGKNIPLSTVFAEIKKQTGYLVIFGYRMLDKAKPVSISAKDQPLTEFLKLVFKDQPLEYIIRKKTISVKERSSQTVDLKSAATYSDTTKKITVKGRITNETGDPVVATITLKGTKMAGSTNTNGEFVLKGVPESGTLIIGSINIQTTEVKVNGSSDLKNITVKTKIKEEETIVVANTGYQKLKPNEITGSVTVIDNKTLNQQTGTNIISRLNGVTPGMLFNVGKRSSLNTGKTNPYSIRGLNTIDGNTSPLIILDNFQYDGDINNINPGDVESITILKDAAAASIYGALGGNGVIVITTKRGRFNQKLKAEFNTDIIIEKKPDLYAIPQLSSAEYIYLEEFFFSKGRDLAGGFSSYADISPVINMLKKRKAGTISPADSASQIDALKQIDNRNDLNRYFYRDAVTRQYSLNLRGGSSNLTWFLSGSYDKAISTLDDRSDRINVKLTNEYKPLKNLNVSFSAYYTNATNETGKVTTDFYRKIPYLNYADANGMPLSLDTKKDHFLDTVGVGHLLDWRNFPLEDYKHDKTTIRREQLIAELVARYTLSKGLDISFNYQYQREWKNSERYADAASYYARTVINHATKLSRTADPDTFYIPKGGIGQMSEESERSKNFRAQLSFQNDWQQRKHAVNAIAGWEVREAIQEPGSDYTLYGYNKDPLTYGRVNYNTDYPDFLTGSSTTIQGEPRIITPRINRFVSLFSTATYIFKQRYSFSAGARRNAANVFGVSTNDKWKPLWSAGVAWDISKENFYHAAILPYLKLRLTYGYTGNIDLSKTALMVIIYNAASTPYGTVYADPTRRNPDLRWEKKRDYNIAIEFATKNKAISGSIEYYEKRCTDLYGQTFYDYTTAYSFQPRGTIPANIANTKGNGFDINITSRNLDKAIKWNTTLIFNYNKDIVTDYLSASAQNGNLLIGEFAGSFLIPVVGKPLYAIAAYRWGGLDSTGNPQGYFDGKLYSKNYTNFIGENQKNGINSTSVTYIGPSNPPFFGSLINTVSWKGFSAEVNLLYSFGYYFRKPIFSQTAWEMDGTGYGDFSKRWQKPGDELITNVPVLLSPTTDNLIDRNYFYQFASINVLKADHIRLHYINLNYSFIRKQQKSPFSNVQVYMNVANLGIVWRANKEKIDPLYPTSVPPSKSFTIGLRANL